MVEGARLESVYTVTPYRGFESLSLRQNTKPALRGFFILRIEDSNPNTLESQCTWMYRCRGDHGWSRAASLSANKLKSPASRGFFICPGVEVR